MSENINETLKEGEEEGYIERYIKNPNKIEILIKFDIELPSKVNNFNINDHPLYVRQYDGKIHVSYHKIISKNLFDDINSGFKAFCENKIFPDEYTKRNPSQFIIGYIPEILTLINKEILKRKYNEGHIILRTVSIFDVKSVFILTKNEGPSAVLWPLPIPEFPKINTNYVSPDVIFVRDLIDAMTEYIYYNLDECVRKIITSLDNYFIYYDLKINDDGNFLNKLFKNNRKFKKFINKYIKEEYYAYKERDLKVLRENILFIYSIRCSIVHDKLRLKLDNMMLCKKAIGTLLYIYQSSFVKNDGKFEYIFSFDMQFKMITNHIGVNLDYIEQAEKNSKGNEKIIKNDDELNESMFSSLKITQSQKKKAREN